MTGLLIGIFIGAFTLDMMSSIMPEMIWIGIGMAIGGIVTSIAALCTDKQSSTEEPESTTNKKD